MKRLTNRLYALGAFAAIILVSAATSAEADDKIVAIVNKDVITSKDLTDFMAFMRLQMQQEAADEDTLEERMDQIREGLLDKLIEDRLMVQEARKSDVRIDESRIKARLAEIRKNYPSTAQFQNALMSSGLAQADIERKMRDQLYMIAMIEQKVKSKIIIRPDEVTSFYEKNKTDFTVPETAEAEIFTANNEDTASAVMHDLKRGMAADDIKKRYPVSANSISAHKGEDLSPEIERKVFSLKTGEISEPVLIDEQYYIFRLNALAPARPMSLTEVQERINDYLFQEKMKEGLAVWLDEIKAKAYIKKL